MMRFIFYLYHIGTYLIDIAYLIGRCGENSRISFERYRVILQVKFYSSEKHASETKLWNDNISCWIFLKFYIDDWEGGNKMLYTWA